MTFEEKLVKNVKIRERNLMRPSKLAAEKPDTGVKILKKGAYYLIQDCAKITHKYLAHLAYGSLSTPINDLKGKFTKAEIINFVGRSTEEEHTKQLLHIILTDVGASAQFNNAMAKPIPAVSNGEAIDLTYSEDEDVYGDYNDEGLDQTDEPVTVDADVAVNVDDSSEIVELLLEVFAVK